MKKNWKILLIVPMMVLLLGCSDSSPPGTGLSQNESYLNYFDSATDVTGIVLFGDFYQLPTPLEEFLVNGWEVEFSRPAVLASIYLPPSTYITLDLVLNNHEMEITVANPTDAILHITEALVIELDVRNVAQDEVVVFGGITVGTSRQDVLSALADLEPDEDRNFISVDQEFGATDMFPDPFTMRLDIRLRDGNLVSHLGVEILSSHTRHLTLHRPELSDEDRAQLAVDELERLRNELLEDSRIYTGVIVGVYSESTLGNPAAALGGVIVFETGVGMLHAVNSRGFSELDANSLVAGDTIEVWIDIDYEPEIMLYGGYGAGAVRYFGRPNLILINETQEYSIFW